MSARRTYTYYRIRREDWEGPLSREFGKMTKERFQRLLKGQEEIEGETLLEAKPSTNIESRNKNIAQQESRNENTEQQESRNGNTAQRKRRSKSTAQPQDVKEVPRNRRTSGLNMS